ncbi:hypothetical protein TVAG_489730 [Trichomonas vaginalis G3]|uniref:Uncharacterized protein n=1 Tax=Trichomonas vaginalis (strain ATCC PRA-98 / G3) TaxID=412133 RepID=A2H910_TRIV3|nr:hypothetical protein TVAG_489730 [Trichomonas vaginalis G3]|eukprot:XP_001287037.1 hypothetical protein [Trichomonas vaginalis G3]
MSDVPPTESIPKPEEPTAPAPQQTYLLRLNTYIFTLDFLQFELCLRRYEF